MRFEIVSYEAFEKDMIRYGFGKEKAREGYMHILRPYRKTKHSAGYDIITPISFVIRPGESIVVPTGIKARFEPGTESKFWHLALYIRSSVGIIRHVVMTNQTGVIDADYYNNDDNEGDMLIALYNTGEHTERFYAGDRIIQGIFQRHGLTEDDNASGERHGGVGSTDD